MIDPFACIGRDPEHRDFRRDLDRTYPPSIHPTARIEAFCTVDAGRERPTEIGARSWAMKGCHIAHDVRIGDGCELSPHVAIGGHVEIGDGVKIGMNATIRPRVKIGNGARIGMGAVVVKDVPAGETWVGNPARPIQYSGERDTFLDPTDLEWNRWWEKTRGITA